MVNVDQQLIELYTGLAVAAEESKSLGEPGRPTH